jgi:hypothetical protein
LAVKTVLGLGLGILVICAGQAQAGKYNCTFESNGSTLHTCAIDSSGTTSCSYKFSANITGICAVGAPSPQADVLVCALTTPSAALAGVVGTLPADSVSHAARILAQQPGFVAGGVTIAPTSKGILAGEYIEQQGAPTLAGACTPQ